MKTLNIIQNTEVSSAFMGMVRELISQYPELGTMHTDDFKNSLPGYFKKHFNSSLDFKTLSVSFKNEGDLTLALIKYH